MSAEVAEHAVVGDVHPTKFVGVVGERSRGVMEPVHRFGELLDLDGERPFPIDEASCGLPVFEFGAGGDDAFAKLLEFPVGEDAGVFDVHGGQPAKPVFQ